MSKKPIPLDCSSYSSGNKFVVFCRVAATLQNTTNLFPLLYMIQICDLGSRIYDLEFRYKTSGLMNYRNQDGEHWQHNCGSYFCNSELCLKMDCFRLNRQKNNLRNNHLVLRSKKSKVKRKELEIINYYVIMDLQNSYNEVRRDVKKKAN